jgi:alcohol dehydrogenase class IV
MDTYLFRKHIHRLPGKVIHTVPLPKPEVTEGFGARWRIGELCRAAGYKQVLIVTDKTLHELGYEKKISESLEAAGIGYRLFADICSEPTIPVIDAGRHAAMESQAECIIALGGGSVMDSCKIIAAGVKMPHLPSKVLLPKFLLVPGDTLPVIMVPSTAGTGAEITVGAVVTNEKGQKGSTVLVGLKVVHVVLDSELTFHAPQSVTAACGIDALSHCIEGVVSDVEENAEDMRMSMEGVRLILQNLPKLTGEGGSSLPEEEAIEARGNMCRAAMYGGNAINTQLAGYVHAFAHSIGAKYHLPHGQAISLMLLPVLEFQQPACREKYEKMAQYCGVPDFLEAVRALLKKCGMDKIASPVKTEDHEELIHMVAADSINYSAPVTMNNRQIKDILEQITK